MEQPIEETHGRRIRVLVVEDNPESAMLLAELLDLQGFETAIAINGGEAIRKAHEFLPDIILLDIGLPVMDGYQVAQALREEPNAATALIVAVTGHSLPEDREQSYRAGIDLHMTKPVDIAQLKEILAAYKQEFQA